MNLYLDVFRWEGNMIDNNIVQGCQDDSASNPVDLIPIPRTHSRKVSSSLTSLWIPQYIRILNHMYTNHIHIVCTYVCTMIIISIL